MMIVSDLKTVGSIFNEINLIEPFSFINDFGADNLDMLLYDLCGDRSLFLKVTTTPINELARMIVYLHKKKWQHLIDIELQDFDIGGGVTRRLSETTTENETSNKTNDSVNKVSAYNTDEMINNDGTVSTGNEGFNNTKTRILSDGNYSINTAFSDLQLISKTNIINTVLKDVAIYLALSIY